MDDEKRLSTKLVKNSNGTITKIKYKKLATPYSMWLGLYEKYRYNIPELIKVLDFKFDKSGTTYFTMPYLELKGVFFEVYEKSNQSEQLLLAQKYYSLLNRLILSSKELKRTNDQNLEEYFFHRDLFIYNIHVDINNDLHILDPDSAMYIKKDIIISQIATNFSLLTAFVFK